MPTLSKSFGLALAAGLALSPATAVAGQSLNPALSRLVLDHRCHAQNAGDGSYAAFVAGAPKAVGRFNDSDAVRTALLRDTGRDSCTPDHTMFKQLINQWGFVLAPSAMHTARTTGYGGFHFALEGAYTKIDDKARYWRLGTEGPRDPSSNAASVQNSSPPGMVQVYSARVRKAFGFGVEVATQVGFVPDTTILSGGADARISLLEGFRTGFGGILPDVAVGAGVRTITGTPEFQLTTAGLDVQLSKPLTIASQAVLTPWIGWQYLWIFGDSGLIDTTPATDPVGYCQYSGINAPGNPDPDKQVVTKQPYDGQPVCAGGSPIDFNNNVVFNNARLERQRMMIGLNYRYEMVSFGSQFIFDVVSPEDAQVGKDSFQVTQSDGSSKAVTDAQVLHGVPRQWTLVFELGAEF